MSELKEAAKERDAKDALHNCQFTLTFKVADGTTEKKTITLPVFEHRHSKSLNDRVKYHNAALRLLHEAAVQQLVNAYEQLMGDIVRRYIFKNPAAAAAKETISYKELLEFSTLEEAKRKVVEKQVVDFIRNNDTSEHLKYLREHLNTDVQSHFSNVPQFTELVLHRHAIVHAGGIATLLLQNICAELT